MPLGTEAEGGDDGAGQFRLDRRLTRFNGLSHLVLRPRALVSSGVDRRRPDAGGALRAKVDVALELGSDPALHRRPLVSCLMVTRNRLRQAQIAIGCFRQQTWRQRELVVVDSSKDSSLARWIESLGDARIRTIHLPGCADSLGDLRNLSVEAAQGTHVCQWDDDDLSHRCRLEAQIALMKATKAPVSVLFREIMWVPRLRLLSVSERRAHENTLLCEKAILPPFPSLARGEDTPILEALTGAYKTAYLDQPELYVYVAHGANTWDDRHMIALLRKSTAHLSGQPYLLAMAELERCYPLGEYMAAIGEEAAAAAAG